MNDTSSHPATAASRERARESARDQARERVQAAELRRRRALVFGEVLPEGTRDDLPEQADPVDDDWWRRQVPPHHG